jgi:hypothetical protein
MAATLVLTLATVEILLWLVPPVVVTLVAMTWVGWVGREGRREVDREELVRRLGAALEREQSPRPIRLPRRRERSTGVALRRTPRTVVEPTNTVPADDRRRAS